MTISILFPMAAMAVVVGTSNFAVQYPLNDWITWGHFAFPFAFLVTDLTNRTRGVRDARKVVFAGFAIGIVLSILIAPARIAFASGAAFLLGQLLDVSVFDRLRRASWWKPPLVSSLFGATLDTWVFYALAFAGTGAPWITFAIGDLAIKLVFAGVMVAFYRLAMPVFPVLGTRGPAVPSSR